MAGIQTIIDNCSSININRRKVVGIQITRNEIPRVSQTPTKNPWRMTIEMPNSLRYSQARDVLEALDAMDRTQPEEVTFSNNPNLSWIFAYQGVMTSGQINTIDVSTFVGNQLVLTNLPSISSGSVLFRPNDLIQIGNYPYPFTVVNTVTRGSGSTVTITTNRPNIITDSVVGLGIVVGNTCTFNMFCPNMPTYKLIPGGQLMSGTTMTNNALIEFSDAFELYEFVGDA